MPPVSSRRSGRFRVLRWIGFVLLVLLLFVWWATRNLGHILYRDDPLDRADAIFVLAGSWLERVAEAGDLYLEGRAPALLLSREFPDGAEASLRNRGIAVPSISQSQVAALTAMGVPREAISVTDPQAATATEADTLKRIAAERGWTRVIVVSSKSHTGRAGLAFDRRLAGTGVSIAMRASRYDAWDPDRWWRDRVSLRVGLIESQKMLLYWLGAAD